MATMTLSAAEQARLKRLRAKRRAEAAEIDRHLRAAERAIAILRGERAPACATEPDQH